MASTLVRAALAAGLVLATGAALAGEITLYERPGFQGRSMTLRNNMPDLDRTRFNDRAESIVVRDGVWEVCTDARYGGRCARLQPGEYPTLDGPLNDRISSAREVAQYAPQAAVAPPPPAQYGRPEGYRGGGARAVPARPSSSHDLRRRVQRFVPAALVFGDDLRAQQQHDGADLDAQQYRDRRRQRSVDHLDLRHRVVVPNEHVSCQLP